MTPYSRTPLKSLWIMATFVLIGVPSFAQPPTARLDLEAIVHREAQQVATGQPAVPVRNVQKPQEAAIPSEPPDTRPTFSLTLDDAVALALDHNLNISVQRLNPPQFDTAIAALRANYWPQANSQLGTQSQANPPTNGTIGIPTGASYVTQSTTIFNGGLSQNVPWGGGQLAATMNNVKSTTTSTAALYNPYYLPTFSATFTQPLLRGRSIDPVRQQILVTRIAQDISDVQLKSTIVNTLSSVREAYLNYSYAMHVVEVAQQALELASQLVRDNQTRAQVGTIAPIDIVTAQSQEAQARLGVVQALTFRDNAEVALKQLIVAGLQDPNWDKHIVPTDPLDLEPSEVNVADAIRRALADRTDLLQAKKNLEENNISYKFLRNQLLPQADLVAGYSFVGLGGTQIIRQNNNAISSQIVSTIPGGYSNALQSLLANDYPTWNVQLRFSAPIGRNVAAASVAAAKIQADQTALQVRQIELQIATDVTNAANGINRDTQAVRAAQIAQDLAQRSYEAELTKLKIGATTNYNVIQQLNALNLTKNNRLQVMLNYRTALVEFDRLTQTTLNTANVTLLSFTSWGNGAPAVSNLLGPPVGSSR